MQQNHCALERLGDLLSRLARKPCCSSGCWGTSNTPKAILGKKGPQKEKSSLMAKGGMQVDESGDAKPDEPADSKLTHTPTGRRKRQHVQCLLACCSQAAQLAAATLHLLRALFATMALRGQYRLLWFFGLVCDSGHGEMPTARQTCCRYGQKLVCRGVSLKEKGPVQA